MVEMTWVKHPDTGAVAEVPKGAIPQLRQSGWQPLTKAEIAERDDAEETERAKAEGRMTAQVAKATGTAVDPLLVQSEEDTEAAKAAAEADSRKASGRKGTDK